MQTRSKPKAISIAIVLSVAVVLLSTVAGWVYINQQRVSLRERELTQERELTEAKAKQDRELKESEINQKRKEAELNYQCHAFGYCN